MKSIQGTRTEQNVLKAFAGESQARNRYTYFASQARQEGFVQIAEIFEETANQEKEHAKRFFKFLEGGEKEITATFPAGIIGKTAENLQQAATGEHAEWNVIYPEFAKAAREEGFEQIAATFESVSVAEKFHEKRYAALLKNVQHETVFKKENPVAWRCRNCGYIHEGPEAPETCPACLHPRAYYELLGENW